MDDEHKEISEVWSDSLKETYLKVYDKLTFTRRVAEKMVKKVKLTPNQRVLDVACGTGWATMAAAKEVGISGKVIGVDIENSLLNIAREKTAREDISNIEYRLGNAEELDFDDRSFDAVQCASSIFFFNNIPQAITEWHRVLKPGGIVVYTSFGPRLFQPVIKPLGECLSRYDDLPPAVPFFIEPANSLEKCQEFLKQAGFEKIEITTEDLGYEYPSTADYWEEMSFTFVFPRMARLGPANLERFKAEHLEEMKKIFKGMPIPLEIPTLFSIAKKPAL